MDLGRSRPDLEVSEALDMIGMDLRRSQMAKAAFETPDVEI